MTTSTQDPRALLALAGLCVLVVALGVVFAASPGQLPLPTLGRDTASSLPPQCPPPGELPGLKRVLRKYDYYARNATHLPARPEDLPLAQHGSHLFTLEDYRLLEVYAAKRLGWFLPGTTDRVLVRQFVEVVLELLKEC